MSDTPAALLQKYCRKGVIVDTNILLLLLVGSMDQNRIATFKNTKSFTIADYNALSAIVNQCSPIVVTTHILTEVSNLLGQMGEPQKDEYFLDFVSRAVLFQEETILSANITDKVIFQKLGLTDSAIIHIAKELDYLVLTADFPLSNHLENKGIPVVNYNHIRASLW